MSNLDNNEARAFLGRPIVFSDICLIYPPKVNDIINYDDFNLYKGFFTITQEDLVDSNPDSKINPLEYLLNVAYNNKDLAEKIIEGFNFFIHEQVHLLYSIKAILVGDIKNLTNIKDLNGLKLIKEENYFEFQNLIRCSIGEKTITPMVEDKDPRIARMKAKMRERDRVKAKQDAKKGVALKLTTTLASISCMGFGLNPLNIGELSYASIQTLMRFYQNKDKYEIDIRSLQAGADSKKIKPENWIKNLED